MTLRKTLMTVATATALSALSSAAWSQTPPGQPAGGGMGGGMGLPRATADVQPWADRLFGRLDANQDAQITGNELAPLSQGEVAARGGSRLRAMISQADANHDARVSREELGAGADRMFARMDRNGDGQLADDEMPQPPAQQRAMPMPMPSSDPMPMPTDPGGR
jgi:hypothetical protein